MKTIYPKVVSIVVLALTMITVLHAQEAKTVSNIDASSKTAYFSFTEGKEVADASQDWDIAFNRTTILINGGSSGTGKATGTLLKDTSFEKVTKQPSTGLKEDTESEKAIPAGSGNGWYEYDMSNHSINPIPGRILVVKTSAGKYVKVEILSYYNKSNSNSANYSFRYSFL
ncbi:HmuY family protein [Parapedobacter koreensis]|uniref:HmuY protein n=1 Tax=Parapedobacter koreensis TaxID=332977 RepID=A0A1H7P3Q0_9SPHI|nr:HmuY family protein [Parapedobacter koreensis]SEL30432.1 HmuY protein [Parapedobacter koreensis]